MRKKTSVLRTILASTDVCMLQETHGADDESARILNLLKRDWLWHSNVGEFRNAGGESSS